MLVGSTTITVLVAWACILFSPYKQSSWPRDGTPSYLTDGPNGIQNWWMVNRGFGVWESRAMGSRSLDIFSWHDDAYTPAFFRGGWPMYSMQSVVVGVPPNGADPNDYDHYLRRLDLPFGEIIRRGLQTSQLPAWWHVQEARRLPIIPFWPGFIVDTSFYFVMSFGFLILWQKARKPTPNQSPEPTAVGAGSSAIAVHVASRRWLSFFR
jgi:hypothetical protein